MVSRGVRTGCSQYRERELTAAPSDITGCTVSKGERTDSIVSRGEGYMVSRGERCLL